MKMLIGLKDRGGDRASCGGVEGIGVCNESALRIVVLAIVNGRQKSKSTHTVGRLTPLVLPRSVSVFVQSGSCVGFAGRGAKDYAQKEVTATNACFRPRFRKPSSRTDWAPSSRNFQGFVSLSTQWCEKEYLGERRCLPNGSICCTCGRRDAGGTASAARNPQVWHCETASHQLMHTLHKGVLGCSSLACATLASIVS